MDKKTLVIIALAAVLIASIGLNVYYATMPTKKIPTASDTLYMAEMYRGVTSFDPGTIYDWFNAWVDHECYDTLLTYKGNQVTSPQGELAESWEVSADGLTWTFHIRNGMKFHSGNPVTAADVVYTFNRVVNLKESPSFLLTQLGITNTSTVALSNYTAQVKLGKKWAKSVVEQMFSIWPSSIIDSKLVKEKVTNNDYGKGWLNTHSAGSGPYMITEWIADQRFTMEWNPNYWKWSGTTKIRDPPAIKKVIASSIPESNSRMLMLEKGEADIALDLEFTQLKSLETKQGFRNYGMPNPSSRFVTMMMLPEYKGKPNPLADVRVREAVRYSIDYDGIVNSLYMGYTQKLQTIVPGGMPGNLQLFPYAKNVTKAKELLTAAGYPNGISIDMVTVDRLDWKILAEKVQSDLRDSGITVNLEIVAVAVFLQMERERNFQTGIRGFGLDYYDADSPIGYFGHSTTLGTDAPIKLMGWRCGYVNQTVAAWIDQARATLEWSDRAPLYEKIQKELLVNGPIAMIHARPAKFFSVRTWIEGLTSHPSWYFEAEDIYKESA